MGLQLWKGRTGLRGKWWALVGWVVMRKDSWDLKVIRSVVDCQGSHPLPLTKVRRLKLAWAFGN